MAIKGLMFDKDGTLVDFQATWFAIGDALALRAAAGDRARADGLLERAGYDFERQFFRGDSVFAAGTNADIVALWYPDSDGETRKALVAEFDSVTAETGAARSVALPGSLEALAVVPWSDRSLVALLTPDVLPEVRRTYPSATVEDLLATFVSVVVRRPA